MDNKYKDIGDPIDCAIEECSEVIHALCKVKRFGWLDYHPDTKVSNVEYVHNEIFDLIYRLNQVLDIMRKEVKSGIDLGIWKVKDDSLFALGMLDEWSFNE